MRWHGEPPTFLSLDPLEVVGVRHAFTTRHHGSFDGVASPGGPFSPRCGTAMFDALDVPRGRVHFARQVHGTACLVVEDGVGGLAGTADALVTKTPGRPLAIFTADCLAILLVDPERRVLAVAHAGWRGTVGGLAGRLVALLGTRFGAVPSRLCAAIGPSIGPCCYEVDEPVVSPLRAAFPAQWARWATPERPGRWQLDLWQANADQLVAAGLRDDAVWNPRLCTGCRRDLFFSYRKEGPGRRLATLALLT